VVSPGRLEALEVFTKKMVQHRVRQWVSGLPDGQVECRSIDVIFVVEAQARKE